MNSITSRLKLIRREFVDDESGMMSIANVVLVLLFALLFTATINNSHIANRKVERQVAVDAVAQSANIWMARGMNAITASNHLMGELTSMVIIHEAIGGKKQEKGVSADDGANHSKNAEDPRDLKQRDKQLRLGYYAAYAASLTGYVQEPDRDVYELVYQRSDGGKSEILAEATLLDAKMDEKEWLTRVYGGLVVAAGLKAIGYTYAAGQALEALMLILERIVEVEYRLLKAIHSIADALLPAKQLIRDQMLPFAKQHTTNVARATPIIAREVAKEIGEMNGVTADVFPVPGQLELPVQIDPLSVTHTLPPQDRTVPANNPDGCGCPSVTTAVTWDQVSKMTQLARATFPWVNYHRQPIRDALGKMFHLTDAEGYYFHWSNGYSKFVVQELQDQQRHGSKHLGLYVLKGYEGPDKGFERWNIAEYSTLADEYFTLIGLAHQPAPRVIGMPLFQQQHPDGMLAYSMALLYNGNDQQRPEQRIVPTCKRIVPARQANTGMDTLNWYPGSLQESEGCAAVKGESFRSGDNRPFELLGINLPADYPRIQVNWQSKLVPATAYRLEQLKQAGLPELFEKTSERLLDSVPRSLTTH